MASKVPGWIERLLLPRLSSMEGELKGIRGEMEGELKAVRGEMEGARGAMEGTRGEIESIKGEVRGIKGELEGTRRAMEGEFKAVHSEAKRLVEKIDSSRNEMVTKFDSLERRVDFAKDFGVLQAKVARLEATLPKV